MYEHIEQISWFFGLFFRTKRSKKVMFFLGGGGGGRSLTSCQLKSGFQRWAGWDPKTPPPAPFKTPNPSQFFPLNVLWCSLCERHWRLWVLWDREWTITDSLARVLWCSLCVRHWRLWVLWDRAWTDNNGFSGKSLPRPNKGKVKDAHWWRWEGIIKEDEGAH